MDDGSLILLGLIGIIAMLLGPIGFFLTLGARSRLKRAEAQLAALIAGTLSEDVRRSDRPILRPRELSGTYAPPTQPSLESAAEPVLPPPPPPTFVEPPPAPISQDIPREQAASHAPASEERPALRLRPEAAKPGLEERLGAHWAVIVGGVALAFGALLLVKYSIEQGFFGPGLRIVCGLLLGVGLVAAGEYLRRKERDATTPNEGAPIPAVLTGAGTVAAFGSLYAAHALYGFIGPGVAFILMGAVGVATMFAAALHGPALAGLGLLGALAAPMLVTSRRIPIPGRSCPMSRSSARRPMAWRGCGAGYGWRSPPRSARRSGKACSCSISTASTVSISRSRASRISSSRRRSSSSCSRWRRIGRRRLPNSAPTLSPPRPCSAARRSPR